MVYRVVNGIIEIAQCKGHYKVFLTRHRVVRTFDLKVGSNQLFENTLEVKRPPKRPFDSIPVMSAQNIICR